MCTLAVYYRMFPGLPVCLAANRDEFYARPTRHPALISRAPHIFGGQDEVAGGSWLTLSENGLIIGVLNRRTKPGTPQDRTSRGQLCLDLARLGSATAAAAYIAELPTATHNPFNILIADAENAFVAQNRAAGMSVVAIDPGLHVLTNLDLNDHECPRISHSWAYFAAAGEAFQAQQDPAEFRRRLQTVLSDHVTAVDDRQPTDQICIHTPGYGTRSSSMIFLHEGSGPEFYHASGAPCETNYEKLPQT